MLDERTKEWIALGASVCAHCQPCLTYHVNKTKEIVSTTEGAKHNEPPE